MDGDFPGELFLSVLEHPPNGEIELGILHGVRVEADLKFLRSGFHGLKGNAVGLWGQQNPLVTGCQPTDNSEMTEWSKPLAAGEAVFLLLAVVLFVAGVKAAYRARCAKTSASRSASPWMLACFSLVFLRHWALEQEVFRGPSEALQRHVEKVPELVQKLQGMNDWIFHNAILIGIPLAFLLGFLFHMAASFALRWVFRIPLFILGCAGLFILHQIVTKRADGVAEAVGHLWSTIKGS